jgi:hypothetical protein
VNDRVDASGPVGSDREPLSTGRTVADHAVELLARQHQLDRATDLPRREGGQEAIGPRLPGGPEGAAHERGDDPDLIGRDPERLRVGLLGPGDSLHLVPHRQMVCVPAGDGRGHLHRVVVFDEGSVGQRHADGLGLPALRAELGSFQKPPLTQEVCSPARQNSQ